jgi:carbon storage regulator
MLVLTRKVDEKIRIGEDIEITVVAVSGNVVRLGIDAPRSVTVLRSEIYEEVQNQNREALLVQDQQSFSEMNNFPELLQIMLTKSAPDE